MTQSLCQLQKVETKNRPFHRQNHLFLRKFLFLRKKCACKFVSASIICDWVLHILERQYNICMKFGSYTITTIKRVQNYDKEFFYLPDSSDIHIDNARMFEG